MNSKTSPADQAARLVQELGLEGAQAEAEQAVNRATYFHLDPLRDYWLAVVDEVLQLRDSE